jgi:hypothetical protein
MIVGESPGRKRAGIVVMDSPKQGLRLGRERYLDGLAARPLSGKGLNESYADAESVGTCDAGHSLFSVGVVG